MHNAEYSSLLHEIKNGEQKGYPEGVVVAEISASTPLLSMFNHTLIRILTFNELQDFMKIFAESGGKFDGELHF